MSRKETVVIGDIKEKLNRAESSFIRGEVPSPIVRKFFAAYCLLNPFGVRGFASVLAEHLGVSSSEVQKSISSFWWSAHLEKIENTEGKPPSYRAVGKLKQLIATRFVAKYGQKSAPTPAAVTAKDYEAYLTAAWAFRKVPAQYLLWCTQIPPSASHIIFARTALAVALSAGAVPEGEIREYVNALALLLRSPNLGSALTEAEDE